MEKSLDSELWHACAGGMVKMPPVNSKVFYFPQGHAEHASSSSSVVDFPHLPRIPPLILCHVTSVKFLADPKTDEVYVKIGLIPDSSGTGFDQEEVFEGNVEQHPPVSFVKTLTQSDANNGGGFSVPRYCADTIFPPLDYTADPPAQNIIAKDLHGEAWKFRHNRNENGGCASRVNAELVVEATLKEANGKAFEDEHARVLWFVNNGLQQLCQEQ